MMKICKECGKSFEATNGMQKFCTDVHYRKCVICREPFEVTKYHLTAKDAKTTCSKKCATELRKRTNVNKYGGIAPACSSDVRERIEQTNLDKYGVKHAAQSDVFKQKSIDTSLARYGTTHFAKTNEGRAQVSERWQDNEFKQRVADKQRNTNLSRYGVNNIMKSTSVQEKNIEAKMTDATKINEFVRFKEDARTFIHELALDHMPTIRELTHILGVNESTIGVYIHKHNCSDLVNLHVSVMEQEVTEFIKHIDSDIHIENNTHQIIKPKELDIYLPEYRIGIECNPTATHNSSINVFDSHEHLMSSRYHQIKTQMCEDADVFLFHIFGSEWTHNRLVIQSMIRNVLGKNEYVIYARKTNIKEVSAVDAKEFLNSNHRQGNANSPIRLGLYDENNTLVSLMTFGKMRNTIGTGKEELSDCFELVRFCSRLNTSVVGGASKLFKHFIKTYQPNRVRSFSDRAHTRGTLYSNLGFQEVRRSDPGYVWVDTRTDIAYNRINAQKKNICKALNDNTIDLSKTERQIMIEHGFVQVYDAGTITWEWIEI